MKHVTIKYGAFLCAGLTLASCKVREGESSSAASTGAQAKASTPFLTGGEMAGKDPASTPDSRACGEMGAWVPGTLAQVLGLVFYQQQGVITLGMPQCLFAGGSFAVAVTDLVAPTDLTAKSECYFKAKAYPDARVWQASGEHCYGIGVFSKGVFDAAKSTQAAAAFLAHSDDSGMLSSTD